MRPLLMLWGCLVLPGYGSVVDPKEISGFEGDTVSLQCTYEEQLKKNQKYWCREAGLFISRCTGTVFSGEYGQEGRVSVHDNPQENRFTVILRNLTLKDMGKYWCGVKRLGFDKTMSVSLLVFPGTSLHSATSPPAGISQPATQLDSTSTQDTSFVPSSSSKSRVSIPLIRILAPVLVLLALLLATGLAALGNYMFQRREKAQLASETQKKDKIHLSHLTSEDDEASWRDPKGDMTPASTLPMSGDEPGFSKFSSV
ncbi:CMRF35-like molecule 9 isoform X6 [Bubalus kerabau]|uniref:CMRF35-like molecule 9 isoform X15 n=1 Tax=Bubalus bubalis TaxID=89462 RepID=UPI00042D01C6|nr:CMRF35-like molecule 9 isoform X15 [Bubalus bubalis]XP_055431735.1 CMRF35-like molecule 9 isoform X6 [Bubalus carabanensis]